VLGLAFFLARPASAQELEPGAYTVSPVGVNFIGASYALNRGDVTFDPSLPIEQAHAAIDMFSISYGRAINAAGRSGTFLVALPIIGGSVSGIYIGQFTQVDRHGLGDLRLRVGVNLYGAPAMTRQELAAWRRRTTIGASLAMTAPIGQYDDQKLINLGTNRWAFKPELAVTHNVGRAWMFEAYGGAWLFTDNTDFYGGHVRSQRPIGSLQFHVRYTVRPGLWLSFNSNFYSGGRTSVDGKLNLDLQKNSRVGGTISWPLTRRDVLKAAVSRGAYTTIGADFTSLSVAYQHVW
jgi:Putative MetA-pathway of phenol degradation